jgi:hypothetical protein
MASGVVRQPSKEDSKAGGELMATLENVIPELVARIRGVINELADHGIVAVVTEGWRSLDEQWRLYRLYKADPKHNPLAAYPGTSNHGKVDPKTGKQLPSRAVDLALLNDTTRNRQVHGEVARKWGLFRAVNGEYWHLELSPNRGPMPIPMSAEPIEEEIEQKEEEMPRYVDKWTWPNGDQVQVFPNGSVECYGKTRFYGSMNDLRDDAKQGFKELRAVAPVDANNSQSGYILYDQRNAAFDFKPGVEAFFKK